MADDPREARLREELAAHREALTAEFARQGMNPEAAARAARLRLGGEEQIRMAWRAAGRWAWLGDLRRDLALGWRALRRSPGFTLVVVLSLALGIGANAAIFSVFDAALLRQLPVHNPGQLALLYWHAPRQPASLSQSSQGGPSQTESSSYSLAYPTYEQLRDHGGRVLASVFGFAPLGLGPVTSLMVNGQTNLSQAALVTGEFFSGLGVGAARGRLLTRADERAGAPEAAVISYGYWTRQFGRDPAVVGRAAAIDGTPATIVGVAAKGFQGVQPGTGIDLWVAMSPTLPVALAPWGYTPPRRSVYTAADYWWLQLMARLQPGVTRAQAVAALGPMFQRLSQTQLHPAKASAMPQLGLAAGDQGINSFAGGGPVLWTLLAIVGVLLLLACVNVAALLLARATARRREIAVRLALGAGRGRLIRQLLTESILLACIGGAVGAALAPLGLQLLLVPLGAGSPLPAHAVLDGRVVAFTVGISVLTGILFGLAPAFRCTRISIGSIIKSGRAGTGERVRLRGDKALAITQVALSLVLLVAAGLFLRSLGALQSRPLGFHPDHVLLFGLDGSQAGYKNENLVALYARVRQHVAALPGVESVTASRLALLSGWTSNGDVSVPGVKLAPADARSFFNGVGPAFLATMGIPLRLGRDFTAADLTSARGVAIVNHTLAQHLFGSADPLGRLIVRQNRRYTIIGVSADARYGSRRGAMPATLYLPYTQTSNKLAGLTFEVRLAGDPHAVIPEIRKSIHTLDPTLTLAQVRPQTEQDQVQVTQPRTYSQLAGFFGLLGLLLAAIGIEGTMAYSVARRRGEIGIRMALGAGRGQVLWGVLRETLVLAAAGIVIGLAISLAAARLLASQLYGIQPTDPLTLTAAAVLLLLVAAAAGWWPARRAARTDPMRALRSE